MAHSYIFLFDFDVWFGEKKNNINTQKNDLIWKLKNYYHNNKFVYLFKFMQQ